MRTRTLERRCTAMVSDGSWRCKNAPILGGTVCNKHGGAAPQVKRKAQERLRELQDPAINALRRALEGQDLNAGIRAATVVLDRTGLHPKQAMEHSGPDGGPIERNETRAWEKCSTETLRRLNELLEKAEAEMEGAEIGS